MYEPMYQGYSSGGGGSSSRSTSRLPPMHAIGKAKPVDEDEPPDIPLEGFGLGLDSDFGGSGILHQASPASPDSVFDASDAEDACVLLRRAFHMLGPGRHACKRNPDHAGSHFVHCQRGVKLGGFYSRLRRLLAERAWLELTRDCVYRLRSAQLFVEELEGLLNAEYRTAYAIRHGCVLEAPVSKLYCLNALCEDLRVHAGHWNSVKQRVNTSRWLRPLLGYLCRDLGAVRGAFAALVDRSIFLLERLVHVGFEVLAHCDVAGLTPDILWNITRGLEDLNSIVAAHRLHSTGLDAALMQDGAFSRRHSHHAAPPPNSRHPAPSSYPTPSPSCHPCPYLHPTACSPAGRLSEGIRSIPFQKVLAILANERSRYAAQLTHRFFTANDAFLALLNPAPSSSNPSSSATHPLPFQWDDGISLQSPRDEPVGISHHQHRYHDIDEGDGDEDGRGKRGGSQASLSLTSSSMLLQVAGHGHLPHPRLPDLSALPSPLVEFSQKEQQFADSFLQIVCTSTSLLRKNNNNNNANKSSGSKSKHHHHHQQQQRSGDMKIPPMSPVVGRPPLKVSGDTPVVSRSDSRRKTVSWGDNADTSIRSQVVAMYMSVLWQHFGRNLDLFLDEPAWTGKVGLLQSPLGTVLLHGHAAVATLRHMMEHICMKAGAFKGKDMFPPGSVSAMLGVVVRLHALSAFGAWDSSMSSALSRREADKCYPHAGSDGRYSTHCGELLRLAYRPMTSLLQELGRSVPSAQHETAELLPQCDLDLSLVSGVSCRLMTLCRLSHSWCSSKLHHALASWNVKTYLFVANTDLMMLQEAGQQTVGLLEMLASASPASTQSSVLDQLSVTHITQAMQECNLLNTQLKGLEDSTLKQFTDKFGHLASSFFAESLPPAKSWRRKAPAEFPEDASSYVQNLWDSLLVPVTEGLARLPISSQLQVLTSVLTSVTTAWTASFLKDKVKFSLQGAQQLGVDFDSLRTHFTDCPLPTEVRRTVLELSVFRQLGGIVQLLKRQPPRRATSRFRDCSTEDLACNTREVSHSPSASRSELPAHMEEAHDGSDVCLVPNPEEWLSLRVIGGSRSWRFPSCFGTETGQQ